jgi:ankyrin repeat protein
MSGGNWKEMFGAAQSGDVELLRYHLRMGVDPNYQHPEYLCSALVESAREGHLEVVQLLIESGADPFVKAEWEGKTALEMAEIHRHPAVVEYLRKKMGLPPRRTFWQKHWPRWKK